MEGFNLFQEKIKGEVKASAYADPYVLFLQQDMIWNADLLDFTDARYNAINYQTFQQNLLPEMLEGDLEFPVTQSSIDVRMDFSDPDLCNAPTLEDLRYTFFNYNNDLGSQDKKSVIMLFDYN